MRLILLFLLSLFIPLKAENPPALVLANEYKNQDIIGWAMSEKLDGVRGFWDGKKLLSRNGTVFTPPANWAKNFPPFALDGELFSERGQFEYISATVRAHKSDWSKIKLYVFDVPNADGDLLQRLQVAQNWKANYPNLNFEIIEQHIVKSKQEAEEFFAQVEAQGGEGVVFRNPQLSYQAGRSAGFLK